MKKSKLIINLEKLGFYINEKKSSEQMIFYRENTEKTPKLILIINNFACGNHLKFDSHPMDSKYHHKTSFYIKRKDIPKEAKNYLEKIKQL